MSNLEWRLVSVSIASDESVRTNEKYSPWLVLNPKSWVCLSGTLTPCRRFISSDRQTTRPSSSTARPALTGLSLAAKQPRLTKRAKTARLPRPGIVTPQVEWRDRVDRAQVVSRALRAGDKGWGQWPC